MQFTMRVNIIFYKIEYLSLFVLLISISSKAMDLPNPPVVNKDSFVSDMRAIKNLIFESTIQPIFTNYKVMKKYRQLMKSSPIANEYELEEGIKGYKNNHSYFAVNLNKVISEGGTHRIYTAQNLKTGEILIAKRRKVSLEESVKTQYGREWQVLEALGLARAYMIGEVKDKNSLKMIIMAYIPGINLEEALAKLPRSLMIKAMIARAIFKALADLHHRGIFHGDIKLSNMHLDYKEKEGELVVRWVDFEGSMFINDPTPPFCTSEEMLPPGFDGRKLHEFATEYFSLGKSLVHLLTGKFENLKFCDHRKRSSQCESCAPDFFLQEFPEIFTDAPNMPTYNIIRKLSVNLCESNRYQRIHHELIPKYLKEFDDEQKTSFKKMELSKKRLGNSF